MVDYAGPGTPLSQNGLTSFCTATNTGEPELWAVLAVETSGCGFLSDRRPKILFERHWFHHFTAGQYDISHPDISQPTQGGYGAAGAYQYSRLAEATALDQDAALKSTSWGLPQIMGFNFNQAGFPDVSTMVTDMVASEDNQLSAMANFLLATGLATSLSTHDWTTFASGYNGPNYAANNYDGLLKSFYAKYVAGPLPDFIVRGVQMLLIYKGFDPGGIDGIMGPTTSNAIQQYQNQNGMPPTGTIDAALLHSLSN